MSASISDAFVVTNLPRLSPKSDVGKMCKTSEIIDSSSNDFDLSISGSFLSTFITRPSPKMIWSNALSPQTTVNSMDSFDFSNLELSIGDEIQNKKIFVIGLTERNKHKMRLISYGEKDQEDNVNKGNLSNEEDENQSISVANEEDRTSSELDHFKVVNEKTLNVESCLINVKFSKNGEFIYTFHENGNISLWKFSLDDENTTPVYTFKNNSLKRGSKIIFNKFIQPEQLNIDSNGNKVEKLLLSVEKSRRGLCLHLFSLKANEILEIFNKDLNLEINEEEPVQLHFEFDPSGKLIVLNSTNSLLTTISLPNVDQVKSFSIDGIFSHEPTNAPVSIMPASTNRILITKGSTIALVDIKFEALLSLLDLYPRSKEFGSVKPPREATLLNVPIVAGNTQRSKITFALVILKNTKENLAQIHHVSVDTGLGKLSDVLGKAIPQPQTKSNLKNIKENFIAFPAYIHKQEFCDSNKESENLNSRVNKKSDELSNAFKKLQSLKLSGNIDKLERSLIAFLKYQNVDSKLENPNEFKVYEAENDRLVDPKFFSMSTQLLFDFNEQHQLLLNPNQIPEIGLTYVLTHPLFPSKLTPGLLKVLSISPRLLRQAIVTCVSIPCCDLIEQLSIVENDEIFKDILGRMSDDFSPEEITEETIKLMKKKQSTQDKDFNLDKIINKILKMNSGYEVLNSFIDSNGLVLSLHYSKDESQLDKLIRQSKIKIDTLIDDSQLLTLVDQALLNAEKSSVKNSKKNKKKGKKNKKSRNDDTIEIEQSKADLVLGINNSQTVREISKKVPSYTVDRLII